MRSADQETANMVGVAIDVRRLLPGGQNTLALGINGIPLRATTLSLKLISLIESIDLDDYFLNVPLRRNIREILDGFSDREFEYFCEVYEEKLAQDNIEY